MAQSKSTRSRKPRLNTMAVCLRRQYKIKKILLQEEEGGGGGEEEGEGGGGGGEEEEEEGFQAFISMKIHLIIINKITETFYFVPDKLPEQSK